MEAECLDQRSHHHRAESCTLPHVVNILSIQEFFKHKISKESIHRRWGGWEIVQQVHGPMSGYECELLAF